MGFSKGKDKELALLVILKVVEWFVLFVYSFKFQAQLTDFLESFKVYIFSDKLC